MGLPDVIPEEQLPACWSDDVRMNALFAPFRLKAANPESWEMKMKFWSDMLRRWCRARGDPVLAAADAARAFQRKGRTPACIDIVVEEMFRSGELAPLPRYQAVLQGAEEGWVRWGARLAFRPAALALSAVTSLLPARQAVDSDGLPKASIQSTQKFVLESILKEQAASLLSSYPAGAARAGSVEQLARRSGWRQPAFELALAALVDSGRAAVKGDIVKLAEGSGRVSPISERDEAGARLAAAAARLRGDAARLQLDEAGAEDGARAALAGGQRGDAKAHMRRKLSARARRTRCLAALDNVLAMQQQLLDQHHNLDILDTYKTAASAMKRQMQEHDLNEDAVHDTLDDLREVMEEYGEVSRALAGPAAQPEPELEAELRALLAEEGQDAESEASPTPAAPPAAAGQAPPATASKTPPAAAGQAPPAAARQAPAARDPEREFVFDGEERILAELNELGEEDCSPPRGAPAGRQARAEPWLEGRAGGGWAGELRTDERLHPGQALNLDYSSPPKLYTHDFLVGDHRRGELPGVWLYSSTDGPGSGNFQVAPGGERRREQPVSADTARPVDDQDLAGHQAAAKSQSSSSSTAERPTTSQPGGSQPGGSQPGGSQPARGDSQPARGNSQPGGSQPARGGKPGGGSQPSTSEAAPAADMHDLERRLKSLRGFNL